MASNNTANINLHSNAITNIINAINAAYTNSKIKYKFILNIIYFCIIMWIT